MAKKLNEIVAVSFETLHELTEEFFPLLDWRVSPFGEGLSCSYYGVIQILVAGNGDVPELLARSRIDAMMDLIGAAWLAVDNIVKLLEIER